MKRYLYIFIILVFAQCRERYEPVIKPEETNLLVVQGFINSRGQTQINLSRTTLLSDSGITSERYAIIRIEGNDNTIYPLNEMEPGIYLSGNNTLNSNTDYRLSIITQNGNRYVSDWRKEIRTPEIDSITLLRSGGNAEIYVNAYDPENKTRYYKWNFEETWEIHSEYSSYLVYYVDRRIDAPFRFVYSYYDPVGRKRNDSIFRCWSSRTSTEIKLGNTTKLAEDRMHYKLIEYRQGAVELSELYSVLVKQQGLSKEGYEFYEKMKKNSETLGSVFDAQPSELKGNISNTENSNELVIGFIEVATVAERRTFISNDDLPGWGYDSGCEPPVNTPLDDAALMGAIHFSGRLPLNFVDIDPATIGISAAKKECVDCTLRGTNTKPAFWP